MTHATVPSTREAAPRRRLIFVLKLAATVAACTWILTYVDWPLFWQTVSGASVVLVVLVVLLRTGGLVLSSFKWRQLLAIHDAVESLGRLIRLYLVATFLNHFLPTSIGGDAYRIWKTMGGRRGRLPAVVAVLAERVTGLLALLTLGVVAAALAYRRTGLPVAGLVLGLSIGGMLVGLLAIAAAPRLVPRFGFLRRRWGAPLDHAGELLRNFRRHPRGTMVVAALSFVFHVNKIFATWLLLHALGAPLDPLSLTVVMVGVEVVGLLPISLGGLGVVEGSFMYLGAAFGLGAEPALAAALLLRVLNLPLSLAGAHFYVSGDRPPRAPVAAPAHSSPGS